MVTWSCDFTVPESVTTPWVVDTETSLSFIPDSAAIAALILPVVTVSATAAFMPPSGRSRLAAAGAFGDARSGTAVLVEGEGAATKAATRESLEAVGVDGLSQPARAIPAIAARARMGMALRMRDYFDAVEPAVPTEPVPLVPVPLVELLAPVPLVAALEVELGVPLVPEVEPVPPTLPEADRLPEVPLPVALLAVVLGLVLEAVVSVEVLLDVLLGDVLLGVDAVVVPGVVVDVVVVVLLRSQPVAAAVASASAATTGKSFFMASPISGARGMGLGRGQYIESFLAQRVPTRIPLGPRAPRDQNFPTRRKFTRAPASVGACLRSRVQWRKPGSMRSSLRSSAGHSITPYGRRVCGW
jgi:hypothetical protein